MTKLDYEPLPKKPNVRKILGRLVVILVVGGVLALLAERFGPGGVQRRVTKEAQAFVDSKAALVAADPRFAEVKVGLSSHPRVVLLGQIATQDAHMDLVKLMQPPPGASFPVVSLVRVKELLPATAPASNEENGGERAAEAQGAGV